MKYEDLENTTDTHEAAAGEAAAQELVLQSADRVEAAEQMSSVEIPCDPIPALIVSDLKKSLEALQGVKDEILEKIQNSWTRKSVLETRIDRLIEAGVLTDEGRKKSLNESVEMYASLLSSIIDEINEQLNLYTPFTHEVPPATIKVLSFTPGESTNVYFEKAVKILRSQGKNIKKYLTVSYSRYLYGFDLQERNLDSIEIQLARVRRYVEQRQQGQQAEQQ